MKNTDILIGMLFEKMGHMDKAMEHFEIVKKTGDKKSLLELGETCRKIRNIHFKKKYWGNAFNFSYLGAECDDIESIADVAFHYYHGFGINRDRKIAYDWYHKAAEKGHASSQLRLGEEYIEGYDHNDVVNRMPKNIKKGLKFLIESSNNKYYKASKYLGEIYYRGEYLSQDYQEAFKWLNLTIDQDKENKGRGGVEALLGEMYYYGFHVLKDHDKAFALFHEATEKHDITAHKIHNNTGSSKWVKEPWRSIAHKIHNNTGSSKWVKEPWRSNDLSRLFVRANRKNSKNTLEVIEWFHEKSGNGNYNE